MVVCLGTGEPAPPEYRAGSPIHHARIYHLSRATCERMTETASHNMTDYEETYSTFSIAVPEYYNFGFQLRIRRSRCMGEERQKQARHDLDESERGGEVLYFPPHDEFVQSDCKYDVQAEHRQRRPGNDYATAGSGVVDLCDCRH